MVIDHTFSELNNLFAFQGHAHESIYFVFIFLAWLGEVLIKSRENYFVLIEP
jgi:hypothetical protein